MAKDKKEANEALKAARKALDENQQRELNAARKQGHKLIQEQSDEYLRLNDAVAEAEKGASWWLR